MTASPEARALLARHPAIDLHADTLMWARFVGYDLSIRNRPPLPGAAFLGHVDAPRLVEGGFGAQFFGLVSIPLAGRGSRRAVDEQIDLLDAQAARHDAKVRKVFSASQIEGLAGSGTVGALLGVEGAHALEGDLDAVEHFARRGVSYLGLVHFSANEAGYPARGWGRRESLGLTAWGRELVARCEASHLIVDLAHINQRGFFDACRMAARPPIVSHTGTSGVFPHWRNIDDEQIRAVADRGGVVGILFAADYLGGRGIDRVVDHLMHVIDVGGEDAPALGSDWDGMIVPVRGLSDPSCLPLLVDALLARKIPERAIAKILRENVIRILPATAPG